MDIINKSKEYKKDADKILASTNLVDLLATFGEVTFEGSYAYDLMLCADIDLHVLIDNLDREMAKTIFQELVDQNKFSMYQFTNFKDEKMYNKAHKEYSGFPDGYYVGLGYWLGSEKWKIDIWLTDSENENNKYYTKLIEEKCDDRKKLTILEIKKYRQDNKLKIGGAKIYDAVLVNNINSVNEFLKNYEI